MRKLVGDGVVYDPFFPFSESVVVERPLEARERLRRLRRNGPEAKKGACAIFE